MAARALLVRLASGALALAVTARFGGWRCPSPAGCDKEAPRVEAPEAAAPAAASLVPSSAPEPPRAPEIIVDPSTIAIGQQRLATGEPNLDDRLVEILKAQPLIEGNGVEFVAMRNAKPSQVAEVASSLRRAKAKGATVKTEARDGSTEKLVLSFATKVVDCAATAWIAKDGAIDVWPAGGATAERFVKGLAGPDMTLGSEALARLSGACTAGEVIVGGDDRFPWGVVFDLATRSLKTPPSHAGAVVVVATAVPGRKLKLQE